MNLGHSQIQVGDIKKALYTYSCDLTTDLGLEIRDVLPEADKLLYKFFEERSQFRADHLDTLLAEFSPQLREAFVENLLWYGFLGVSRPDGDADYIHSVNYDMNILRALIAKSSEHGSLIYSINPAFWLGLRIQLETKPK